MKRLYVHEMVVWFVLNSFAKLKVGNPPLVSKLFLNFFLVYIILNPMNHWNVSSNSFWTSGIFSEPLHFWECPPVPLKDKLLGIKFLAHNFSPSKPYGVIWHPTVAEEMSETNSKFCALVNKFLLNSCKFVLFFFFFIYYTFSLSRGTAIQFPWVQSTEMGDVVADGQGARF